MSDNAKKFSSLGVIPPDILVPKREVNLQKWAVVACDQYTSEPEYWESVKEFAGSEPSTLNLIYPECYLNELNPNNRINSINKAMQDYLKQGLFDEYKETFFLVRRETRINSGRWGLLAAVDLEQYNYAQDSKSLIRATEGTILERIPPRKEIRKDAVLEFPHILVLIDDPERSVIEPLAAQKNSLQKIYQVDLMKTSGSVTAYAVSDQKNIDQIADALKKLADPKGFYSRYGTEDVLLYAMGDGNHSLATAKSCWEDIKKNLTAAELGHHPARYALVEIENIYDEGLEFEPIHRVLFQMQTSAILDELRNHCESFSLQETDSLDQMYKLIHTEDGNQYFGLIDARNVPYVVVIRGGSAQIPAGTLQITLDICLARNKKASIDYTHGLQITKNLGAKPGNVGIFLPGIKKQEFFSSIVNDGSLPRKTFSMGEDFEKRFYLEGRKIV